MTVRLLLRITTAGMDAELVCRGRTIPVGTTCFQGPDDVADAVTRMAAVTSLPRRPRRLRVELAPPLVQVRQLHGLPPVRRDALRSLVALQAGRFFRRNGTPLITDARWEPRERHAHGQESRRRIARAVAVEAPWLDAIVAGARAAGLRLETVTVAGDTGRPRLQLLSPIERQRQRRASWLAVQRLAAVTVLVWGLAVGAIANRVRRETRQIEQQRAALAAPAQAVAVARRRLDDAQRMIETIERAERDRRRIAASFVAIVGALPDSSYLTSATLDTVGRGSLTGAARQATQVVAALERTGVVTGAKLTGPAIREVAAGHEWERFTMGFGGGDRP